MEPVKITGIDAAASRPSGHGALADIVLTISLLSHDYGWRDHFNANWKHHVPRMKRRVKASGATLIVRCLEEELESGLLDEVKKVVEATNKDWQRTLDGYKAASEREAESRRKERAKLHALSKRLKFD